MPLLEKVYAQANGNGWVGQDGTDSYWIPAGASDGGFSSQQGINFGNSANVFPVLTGSSATSNGLSPFTEGSFTNAVSSGTPVCASTFPQPNANTEFFTLGGLSSR